MATEEVGGGEAADHDVERVVRAAEAAWVIGAEAEAAQVGPAEAMEQEARQKTAKDTTKLAAEKEWGQWQQQRRCAAAVLLEAEGVWFNICGPKTSVDICISNFLVLRTSLTVCIGNIGNIWGSKTSGPPD